MKKIGFLLLVSSEVLLLAGCNPVDPPKIPVETTQETCYTGNALVLYPFGVEVEPSEPDYSWLTTQKLYNDPDILKDYKTNYGKEYYFLNAKYEKYVMGTGAEGFLMPIENQEIVIQEGPTKEPIYFDWTLYQNVWNDEDKHEQYSLYHLQGSVLLTGYLENHMEPACIYCDEEEQKQVGTVEVWRIYPDDGNTYGGFILGYTNGNHLVSEYPYLRYDQINYFSPSHASFKPHMDLNLRDIANDGKLHTFHVILDDGGVSEWAYFGSMVRERDFIE